MGILFFYAVKNFYGGGGLGETGVRMKHTFFEVFSAPLENKEIVEDIVNQILLLKSQEKDTAELENKIDKMVCELYGLTDEECKIIGL